MTAFVRKFSARIAAMICGLRGHEWSRWQTVGKIKVVANSHDNFSRVVQEAAPHGERKCRRCGKVEHGPAPKKRTRNSADTIQGKL